MKYVVILDRIEDFDAEKAKPFLDEGGAIVRQLYKQDKIREIYSRADNNGAIIVFEAKDESEIKELLYQLPLVEKKMLIPHIYGTRAYRVFVD
mgnify:CR=1 FL=1